MRIFRFIIFSLILLCLIIPLKAEDWPGWRGPRGDGTSLEQNIPTKWSQNDNIAYKVEVPGIGHASPVILSDSVFLVTCDEKAKERILLCLDRRSGRETWRRVVIRAPLEAIHRLNSRASSSPATDGMHVYVSFLEPSGKVVPAEVVRKQSGGLRADNTGLPVHPGHMCIAAYDLKGNRKWIARPGEYASVWGYCANPVVFEDTVIINGDHDGEAYIVALNRRTGKTLWKVPRKNRIRSHCTPLIRKLNGKTQMIVAGSHSIVSYDPRDGSRHWFTVGPKGRAVASPVFASGLFFVSAAYPSKEMLALKPDGCGDVTKTHIAWRTRQSAPYVPSPIAVGDFFLAVSDSGIASCFEAKTGKRHWQKRMGKGHSAAAVTAGGLVYFVSDVGITRVVRPGAQFELIAENPIGERCYASPAISRGQIFLRGKKHLFCIGKPPK